MIKWQNWSDICSRTTWSTNRCCLSKSPCQNLKPDRLFLKQYFHREMRYTPSNGDECNTFFFFKFRIKNLKRKRVSWWHLPMFQMRFFSLSDSERGSSGGKNWWVVMTALLPTDLSLSLSTSLWKNWWVLTTLLPICIFWGHSLFRKGQRGPLCICHSAFWFIWYVMRYWCGARLPLPTQWVAL